MMEFNSKEAMPMVQRKAHPVQDPYTQQLGIFNSEQNNP